MRAAPLGMASRYLRKALKGTGGSDFRTMLHEGLHSTRASSTCSTACQKVHRTGSFPGRRTSIRLGSGSAQMSAPTKPSATKTEH